MEIPEHRMWMYNRLRGKGEYHDHFVAGLKDFIAFASQQRVYLTDGVIRCPCRKCKNLKHYDLDTVKKHVLQWGFIRDYYYWTSHGEIAPPVNSSTDQDPIFVEGYNHDLQFGQSNRSSTWEYEHVSRYQAMIHDVGASVDPNHMQEQNMEETPNMNSVRFHEMLSGAEEPLWPGCETHSTLSTALRMMSLKSDYNMPQACFDGWAQLLGEVCPPENKVPKDYYRTRKMVDGMCLSSIKIDCCVNGCMLYWKDDENRRKCKYCSKSRYNDKKRVGGNDIPCKQLHYLPIIPRLQRLFASEKTSKQMIWHRESHKEEGVLRHPSDGQAWKHFDLTHPHFAYDPRNVRLGLCADGFSPFNPGAAPYSCWPVIVTPYNLPPELCMTTPYMFLSMIIPGKTNPKAKIDVYLQPLIDELQQLWAVGVPTYDAAMKQNFNMRAALMWTIGDFPAYGMLSGWSTAGKLACPVCMEDGKGFQLKHGRKSCWFDCHRKFLKRDHQYRRNVKDFTKNKKERSLAQPRLGGHEVMAQVCNYPKITDTGKQVCFNGYGDWHHWTKRSIFWDLPYWKDNLLRHNLDVMHIEKNVFDNVFHTVMDNKEKTKDNLKARWDLQEICSRPKLHPKDVGDGKWEKPKAKFCFTRPQIDEVCEWLVNLKMPDGYMSNIARCVKKKERSFDGW